MPIPMPATCPGPWPALPLEAWRPTYETLHMWTPVVGKVCLALTPPLNHFWNVAFRLTPRGLATPALCGGACSLDLRFDFVGHQLELQRSDGASETLPLEPMTVAAFPRRVMEMLERAGVPVRIWTMPVEVPAPRSASRRTRPTAPTTPRRRAPSGAPCSRWRRPSRRSAGASWASAAPCTSSGAASTSR